jgi:hypothetical protein
MTSKAPPAPKKAAKKTTPKLATSVVSPLRTYLDTLNDLPDDCLLGRIVLFTITEEPILRDDLERWFTELGLDPLLLPLPNKAVDAFKKATSDTKESYPLRGDRTAYALCRDVSSNPEFIRRQITREVKDGKRRRLSYDEAISVTFHRPTSADQSTHRLVIQVVEKALEQGEPQHVRAIARGIKERFDQYYRYMDSQKIRAMVRAYLKKLNAIEIKGGVYFVHSNRDEELGRLSQLVSRLGGGCQMSQIPMADLQAGREMVVAAFEREATQSLNDLTREIDDLIASRSSFTPATYGRLKSRYDEVMRNAEEHIINLQVSQDSTAASAEVALKTLIALQERMIDS